MKTETAPRGADSRRHFLLWLLLPGFLVILIGVIWLRLPENSSIESHGADSARLSHIATQPKADPGRRFVRDSGPAAALSAEAIVADKVSQFGRNRYELVRGIARRLQREVPAEVTAFFEAVASGQWEQINAKWDALAKRSGQYEHSEHSAELDPFWPSVHDTYGAAEQAHLWPAQKLLDYGNAILNSLSPGMVYVGGTDNGRWVPELLNDTSEGEQHIVITQNALADARYVEYLGTLYGDRLNGLTQDDSQRAFREYTEDAQRRFEHDEQFPNEPKQVRPGEDIRMVDGKVAVSGQVAVMSINEKLLQTLMDKNPDLSFAMQESFPMTGLYADALPQGPLFQLRASQGPDSFSDELASQSVEYWRNVAEQLSGEPQSVESETVLKSYSHDVVSAAHLLAAHNFDAEAEQAYRLGMQLCPQNPEPVAGLADVLTRNARENEGRQLLEQFSQAYPDQLKALEQTSALWRLIVSSQPEKQ
jgi:hypothetical protein